MLTYQHRSDYPIANLLINKFSFFLFKSCLLKDASFYLLISQDVTFAY